MGRHPTDHARPTRTSVHIPRLDMGILAMQKLHRLINGEPEVAVKSVVYGELVVRDIVGRILRPVLLHRRTVRRRLADRQRYFRRLGSPRLGLKAQPAVPAQNLIVHPAFPACAFV